MSQLTLQKIAMYFGSIVFYLYFINFKQNEKYKIMPMYIK